MEPTVTTRTIADAADPQYETRVRASFAQQTFMRTLGAQLTRVTPGEVRIELAKRADLLQQHEFLHGGVLASVADTACGYAALSLMPPGTAVLAIEFKINLLAPAVGDRIVTNGRVLRAGRTITVTAADITAVDGGEEKLVATMIGTMMTVRDRPLKD
jgi:uncharacterized protein (TIGR00369 family)